MTDTSLGRVLRQMFACDQSWDNSDIANVYADPKQGLLSWAALKPELLVVEGAVVLGPMTDEQLLNLENQIKKNPGRVDLSSYRWLEVPYQFEDRSSLSEEQELVLAQVFAEAWLMHLKARFPDQSWRTRVIPPSETGSVVGVSFANT